jgi:hypothetical protein
MTIDDPACSTVWMVVRVRVRELEAARRSSRGPCPR